MMHQFGFSLLGVSGRRLGVGTVGLTGHIRRLVLISICTSISHSCGEVHHHGITALSLQRGDRNPTKDAQRYTSSNGLLSAKHESHTSLTTLVACTSSRHVARAVTDWMARRRTQFWNCCVSVQLPLVMVSLVHRHSPLSIDARICHSQSVSQSIPATTPSTGAHHQQLTSVHAACLKSCPPLQSTFHLK